jgi:hypothetical protein
LGQDLVLSSCDHVTDVGVVAVIRGCAALRSLHVDGCTRLTDAVVDAALAHATHLREVQRPQGRR